MDFVALEVIKELQKIDHDNEYFIFVAPGEDKCLQSTDNFHIIELNCPTYPLWEQIALPHAAKKYKVDMLHCTSNTAPIMCDIPLVLTLHDIIFLEPKQSDNKSTYQNLGRVYRRFVVPKILDKCKKIITVSQFECNRIGDFLKLPKDRIIAVYNGYNTHFKPIDDNKPIVSKYIDAEKYIFFLGNTDPKKNVPGTLKAYSIYLSKSKEKFPLLLADINPTVLDSILKEEGIEEIRSFIHVPGYIKNSDLPAIYSGADIFLYTSFRESFGIPLLEAMACGTPVITGDSSALPEIAGDGALMVDVSDSQKIAEKMMQLESDKTLYNNQVKYGLERVKNFSWNNTAKELLSIYHTI